MKLSQEDLSVLASYFRDKPVLRAFLFGSYARGEALAESDVDILLELDYSKHIGLGFVAMKLDLEDLLHKKIDLISGSSLSTHIAPFIHKDKQLIYER